MITRNGVRSRSEATSIPGYASRSLFRHHGMHSESVIGRHFIQILFCVIGTFILHVHLLNYSKHSPHESSTQRNKLMHLIFLLSGLLAVY